MYILEIHVYLFMFYVLFLINVCVILVSRRLLLCPLNELT